MSEEKKTETKAEPAGIIDTITGNASEDGAKLENGEPVMETTEKDD